jgi:hypothetical protein
MAIMGTIVLEDLSIQFRLRDTMEIEYTVVDGLTGEEETKVADASAFAAAIGIAMSPGEDTVVSDAKLEAAMPLSPSLRFIP